MWPFKKKVIDRSYNYKITKEYDGTYRPLISSYLEPEWYWALPGRYDSVEYAEQCAIEHIKRLVYVSPTVIEGKYPE
jgi:hypothetical protein